MALFGDIVGDDPDAVARATSEVVRIANSRGGEGFVAVGAEAPQEVLARPQAHHRSDPQPADTFEDPTDVVIALPRMGEYTEGASSG